MPRISNSREGLRLQIDAFVELATRKADAHTKSPVPNPDIDAIIAVGGELLMAYLGAAFDMRDALASIAKSAEAIVAQMPPVGHG